MPDMVGIPIDKAVVASALKQFVDRDPNSKKKHSGWKHLKDKQLDRVAARLLERNWNGQRATSALFQMAMSIEDLLGLQFSSSEAWYERWHLGRYLLSALCYSPLYRLERESGYYQAPHVIVGYGETVSEKAEVDRTRREPFPKWTRNFDDVGNQLIRSCRPLPIDREGTPILPPPDEDYRAPWLYAVHKIESIPFRVNTKMLQLVEEFDQPDKADKDAPYRIVPKELIGYKRKRNALDKKKKEQKITALKKKDKEKKRLTASQRKLLDEWQARSNLLEEQKYRVEARRRQFELELKNAQKYRDGKPFYQRVSVDYRGRFYLPATFSYQGSDLARSLIEFADGAPLNEDAQIYLFQHLENKRGSSKSVHEKRMHISDSGQLEELHDIATDPAKNFDKWRDTEKPYGFLRACLEVRDAMATPILRGFKKRKDKLNQAQKKLYKRLVDYCKTLELAESNNKETWEYSWLWSGKQLVSHLPIELDQSSSFAQHIAGMMDSDELREKAGMTGNDEGLYKEILDHLKEDGLGEEEKRKIVKLIAIAWGYGAGNKTCVKRLQAYRTESPHKAQYLNSQTDLMPITNKVIGLLKKHLKPCLQFQRKVKSSIQHLENSHEKDYALWMTPSYFIVFQEVHAAKKKQGEVFNGQDGDDAKDVWLTAKVPQEAINWSGMRTKAPPNLVHSYDATLIHSVLSLGVFDTWGVDDGKHRWICTRRKTPPTPPHDLADRPDEPKYPIVTIHDAFACHAKHCPDMEDKLTHGLAFLYSGCDPLSMFDANVTGREFNKNDISYDWVNQTPHIFG